MIGFYKKRYGEKERNLAREIWRERFGERDLSRKEKREETSSNCGNRENVGREQV